MNSCSLPGRIYQEGENQHRIQRQGRGAKKHEIYVAAFGGHLFYDLFVQGWGGHGPSVPPPDPLLKTGNLPAQW